MARPKENPHRRVTFLSDEQVKALEAISKKNFNAPESALIRQAVKEFCQKHGFRNA